ncbi:hypothetical protein FHS83_002095 [Rhizomicrobium palustre]|uniref:DUF364 domain-containing protein n=1 Tax=Rhizomicrobium palustre TaxID=189966 RepID=A0A846N0T1_9PROT|nr:DUF364 domain-containing protein [Rhizomicrobium palustre]NIK88777.1 hypothetical protein [Rhizomicrobium palustre]
MAASNWDIYDALIEALPGNAKATACVCGLHWMGVRSSHGGVGVAMTPSDGPPLFAEAGSYTGRPLRDVAALIKSWNFYEAALGLAAINAALNNPEAVEATHGVPLGTLPRANCFHYLREEFRGKNVAVVGHFRDLEPLKEICSLTILERKPQAGDLPDPACEYVLPGQDIVVITAVTLINKTLPRLLQLSQGAKIVLTGPSTPLTPLLYEHGVSMLAGLVVQDEDAVLRTLQEGGQHQLFDFGARMVTLEAAPHLARRAG